MTMLYLLIMLLILIHEITPFSSSSKPPDIRMPQNLRWESLNALTLATRDMQESVSFYQKLGLAITFGGSNQQFTTLSPLGDYNTQEKLYINLFYSEDYEPPKVTGGWNGWGRCVIHVSNVDAMYDLAVQGGLRAEFPPRDAPWGERYFHIRDPMGHELSFAKRLDNHPRWKRDSQAQQEVIV